MKYADQVLEDEQLVTTVYEALAKRSPKSRIRGPKSPLALNGRPHGRERKERLSGNLSGRGKKQREVCRNPLLPLPRVGPSPGFNLPVGCSSAVCRRTGNPSEGGLQVGRRLLLPSLATCVLDRQRRQRLSSASSCLPFSWRGLEGPLPGIVSLCLAGQCWHGSVRDHPQADGRRQQTRGTWGRRWLGAERKDKDEVARELLANGLEPKQVAANLGGLPPRSGRSDTGRRRRASEGIPTGYGFG
jgi:hypothetical protein